jgi:cell division protein ZapA
MNGEKVATTVTIFGGEYRVKGPDDSEYVRTVARFVDERMREVADAQRITSHSRIAILTSLNLADELLRERRSLERWQVALEERSRELAVRLAAVVDGRSPVNEPTPVGRPGVTPRS